MDRTILLDEPEVSLADRELIVSGWRYSLSEIRSVELLREPAAATGPILMIVVGAVCLLSVAGEAGIVGAILGVGFLVGAAGWWTQKKASFKVFLEAEVGEEVPFESQDERIATRVVAAINEARSSTSGRD
jgi:hypothetical protein